jgi:hypothetical protein
VVHTQFIIDILPGRQNDPSAQYEPSPSCIRTRRHCRSRGSPSFAQSDKWPTKSSRIINPFPVGGGPDGLSRLVADKLGRAWGQPVVVENRPGGNGFIAINEFKRGATDGTDMIQLDNVHIAAYPHLFKKLPYDLNKDFEILMPLFRNYFFVCVPVNSPYKTIGDLIADAKAHPGKLNYGSWSVGNPVHLGSALLENQTGTKMEHVIYKETSQLYQGVANGELTFALGSWARQARWCVAASCASWPWQLPAALPASRTCPRCPNRAAPRTSQPSAGTPWPCAPAHLPPWSRRSAPMCARR